jgi:TetR/AcrR family transcriptional regulator, cholesterol catabolism regulator
MKKTRRETIIEHAQILFKEKGFSATTMRDLAERVGVEAASLYNHIKSKDEILAEICFAVSNTYITHLHDTTAINASTSEKIETLIRLHVQTIIKNRDGVSVANNEWKHLTEPALTQFKEARRDYERGFATLIEQGILEGVFQKVNVSVALFTILSAVRWVELWYKPERDISAKTLEDNIVLMLLNGLKLK